MITIATYKLVIILILIWISSSMAAAIGIGLLSGNKIIYLSNSLKLRDDKIKNLNETIKEKETDAYIKGYNMGMDVAESNYKNSIGKMYE